jgi:hypothetical protein
MMVVNGLKLPDAFLQLSDAIERGGTHLFLFKEEVDAYGNRFQGGLHLWTADPAFQGGTDWLSSGQWLGHPSPEEIQEVNDCVADYPGAIPWISDFSKIVCFGEEIQRSDPFCFDFRENPEEPSIISFDDCYWRRVAPTFEVFIGLYRPSCFGSASREEKYGHMPEQGFPREGLAITAEALAKIQAGRRARKP